MATAILPWETWSRYRLFSKEVLEQILQRPAQKPQSGRGAGRRSGKSPKGSLPDLDVEIHGKRPGAHQPFHQVALPVGELGVDGCRDRSRFRLHRPQHPTPNRGRQSHPETAEGMEQVISAHPSQQSPHPIKPSSTTWTCRRASGTRRQEGSVLAYPEAQPPSYSLRGGTRILLLMAHQPMGWTSTVPRLHQKSWLASFSKPSYRSSTRYPGRRKRASPSEGGREGRRGGERHGLRPSLFSGQNRTCRCQSHELLPGSGVAAVHKSHGQSKPTSPTWRAVWRTGRIHFL